MITDARLTQCAIDVITRTLTKPENAEKSRNYECPECNELCVFAKGKIVPPYFRHRSGTKCSYYTNEAEIHIEAKNLIAKELERRKRTIQINRVCKSCNTQFCFEIEPIPNAMLIAQEYCFEHNGSKRIADVAVIDKSRHISFIFELCNTNPTKCEKRPEPWFEFDAQEICDVLSCASSRSESIVTLKCIRDTYLDDECYYSTCNDCQETIMCSGDIRGNIYFNQRGAGCGKTYESIQLLASSQFAHKQTFIYLTKMRSATTVIYKELLSQIQGGRLGTTTLIENINSGNQTRIVLEIAGIRRVIIIGTIDSFTYAIRDKTRPYYGGNMFEQIVRDIGDGIMKANIGIESIHYAALKLKLTEKYLFIIDEAQDLEKAYLDAFTQVIDKTGIDAYIIGDKLQSISKDHNLFTHVEGINDARVIKDSSQNVNIVKRFHSQTFAPFVNSIVPFSKYELPEITGICNGNCSYSHESADDPIPPILIEPNFPNIYTFEKDELDLQFQKISDIMRKLVTSCGYLPSNFCFIFPIVNDKNRLISALEPYIQDFWVDVFSDATNYSEVLMKNMRNENERTNYWNTKLERREGDSTFYKYVYWHRSEGNQPIDLTESEHSSRILSIHSSKGTGCECVFFLGLSQQSLTCFTGGIPNTLVYESLLHVGLTRQKKYIYVGIDKSEKSDIFRRFHPHMNYCCDLNHAPDITSMRKHIKTSEIAKNLLQNNSDFDILEILDGDKYLREIRKTSTKTIDWGHHVIRCSALRAAAHKYLLSKKIDQSKQQLFAMHCQLTQETDIKYTQYREYSTLRYELNKCIKHNSNPKNKSKHKLSVPVLIFTPSNRGLDGCAANEYSAFRSAIESYIKTILLKLSNQDMCFCPIESIIYCHLIDMIKHPFELSVSIMQIYEIFYYYRDCYVADDFDRIQHLHTYKCNCHQHFASNRTVTHSNSSIRNGIANHYLALDKIDKIMQSYDTTVNSIAQNQHIDYKIDERVKLPGDICLTDSLLSWSGYSADKQIVFSVVIQPQITTMNIHEIIVGMYLVHCIRFINSNEQPPKIVFAIIHLDSEQPLFVDFDDIFSHSSNLPRLKQELKRQITLKYQPYHQMVYQFFEYYRDSRSIQRSESANITKLAEEYYRNRNRSSDVSELRHVFNVLCEDPKYNQLPEYIKNWFKNRDEEIQTADKQRKKDIKRGINSSEWVVDSLNNSLEYAINNILKIPVDDDSSDEES